MSMPVMIHGTLGPDGTLHLDEALNLPPGPVVVTVQPLPAGGQPKGLADVIDSIRQNQQARGYQGRSAQDINAARQDGEADYEQRMRTLWSQTNTGALPEQS